MRNRFVDTTVYSADRKFSRKFKKQAHLTGVSMGLAEAVIFFTYAAVFTYGAYLMRLPADHSGKLSFTGLMKLVVFYC